MNYQDKDFPLYPEEENDSKADSDGVPYTPWRKFLAWTGLIHLFIIDPLVIYALIKLAHMYVDAVMASLAV